MGQSQQAGARRPAALWHKLSDDQVRDLYWFFALLGTMPALRANSLLPHDLPDRLASQTLPALLENPFGLFALIPMAASWLLARRLEQRRYLLAVWPYLLVMLATTSLGQSMTVLPTLYALCALTVLVLFVFGSKVMSAGFGAYVAFLLVWRLQDSVLTVSAVILFVLSVLVARLAIEAVRQNRPLIKALGRTNMEALVSRTLALGSSCRGGIHYRP